jgi:hypothetical protein
MMSKKKKDKTHEPKKTRSSKRASQDITAIPINNEDVVPSTSSAAPKPRRAAGGSKKATATLELSGDDIALRAYYIAEHRRTLNLPGDELGDWVEAERQLRKEAGKKSA